jgi:hypothetical protein
MRNCRLNLADKCYDSTVKNQITLKLTLSAALLALLFGCAVPMKSTLSRTPMVVATSPSASPSPAVSQEAALDKNEVIIDKPIPAQTETASLLARISPAQLARINQALKLANDDIKTLATVNQATPKIRAFVERLSCIRQYNDGGSAVLQNMAAPGVSFKFFVPPMHGTKLHNKSSCLTVSAIALKPLSYQGLAGIQIKVSYLAEDSGETTTSNHEINKNNKGVWWFTR